MKKNLKGIIMVLPAKLFLILWCAFSIFALVWVFLSSLKTNKEFFANVWGIAESPQFSNYENVIFNYHMGQYFLNSIIVVGISVFLILLISTPAAYVLSRFMFPLKNFLFRFIVLGLGVPLQMLLIPLFFMLLNIQLLNSFAGLVLAYVAISLPFTIFLMSGFFASLPSEMEEAASVDGCSSIRTFFTIMLPLGMPAVAAAAIFNTIELMNELMLVKAFITDESKYTLPVGLYGLQGSMQYSGDWVSLFSGFVVSIFPLIVIYIIMSRRIIEGITVGAVKG